MKKSPQSPEFREELVKAYRGMGRKCRPRGYDPNDRDYDPQIHKVLRRLDPIEEHEVLDDVGDFFTTRAEERDESQAHEGSRMTQG